MGEMQLTIEEIARVALTTMFERIGDELDLSDDELIKIRDYLDEKLSRGEVC